jgi:LPXTG-site transpeptidase (sortase) family protein
VAAPILSITPITWNVIGLDSNNVFTGPSNFPVGARVCNSGDPATNLEVAFDFEGAASNFNGNPYINLREGSLEKISLDSLGASCRDFYFEVSITRNSGSYYKTRRYTITASANGVTVATPQPREIYVERLVSQNRNDITEIQLDNAPLVNNTMDLLVGETYNIKLVGKTATNGYNQLEAFINLDNTIFKVNTVTSTYTASGIGSPIDKLYGDACTWDNNPLSLTYRSCIGADLKVGGDVTVTFNVTVLGGGGTTDKMSSLLYDFSGSSYHYNADYTASFVVVNIKNPVNFSKAFSPPSISSTGTSTLTFTVQNPSTTNAVEDIDFTDSLPAGLEVAPGPVTSTTCGGVVTALVGGTDISFVNGTLAANSNCTVSVDVKPTGGNGTYTNTTDNLFINGVDTGQTASAKLTVEDQTIVSLCGQNLVTWSMDQGLNGTSDPIYTSKNSSVVDPTASHSATLSTSSIDNTTGKPAAPSWKVGGGGFGTADSINPASDPYILFKVDTHSFYDITMSFHHLRSASGPTKIAVYYATSPTGTRTSMTGATPITVATTWSATPATFTFTSGQFNPNGDTYFYIFPYYAANNGVQSTVNLDEVVFTGCRTPQTITKVFDPATIKPGDSTKLTFTLSNASGSDYTGVTFSDPLPDGLQVASNAASPQCGGTVNALAGANEITFTGGTIPANSTCPVEVYVTGAATGTYNNTSGFISSIEGGTNTTANGSASASLTIAEAPVFTKSFTPSPIYAGGNSTLKFLLSNPNPVALGLASPAFTDTMPVGLEVAAGPVTTNTCGGSLTATPGTRVISYDGGSIPASSYCEISVLVTSNTVADYENNAGVVSTTVSGLTSDVDTTKATLAVITNYPGLKLLKQVATSASGPWTNFTKVSPTTGQVYYRLTLENTGDVALTNVKVSDPTIDLSGCAALTTPFTLAVGDTEICTIGGFSPNAGSTQNTAAASGAYLGVTYTSSSTAEYLGVEPAAAGSPGIGLIKQVSSNASGPWSSTITTSGNVYYKFIIANTGEGSLSGLSINDPLVSTASCEWYDPLPEGMSTFCVVGPVAPTPGTVTNTATASSTTPALTSTNEKATYTYGSHNVSGLVWNDVNSDGSSAGESGLYNVLIGLYEDSNNNGSYDAGTDTQLNSAYTDVNGQYSFTGLPDGNYIVRINGGTGGLVLVSGGTNPRILSGITADVANVNFGYAAAGTADLVISKTNSTAGAGLVGAAFTWTLTVSNNGTASAVFTNSQRILSDPLPSGATYGAPSATVTGITGNVTCSVSGGPPGTLYCDSNGGTTIAAGQSFTVTISVTPTATGSLANTATVDPNTLITESDETNNTGANTVTVTAPDLRVAKTNTVSDAGVVGSVFTWTLTVSNNGTASAVFTNSQRILSDPLPSGATYGAPSATVTGITGNVTCSVSGGPPGTLYCDSNGGTTIAAGQSFTVTISVTPTATGSLANTATVDPNTLITESDETNNTGANTVTVSASPVGSIAGTVWVDTNGNGVMDAGETSRISGVTISLYTDPDGDGDPTSDGTLVSTKITASDGTYSFTGLSPANYVVIETDPAGYISTTANSRSAAVTAGATQTVNYGDLAVSSSSGLGTIFGKVSDDANNNGLLDAGELPISGATIQLFDGNGNLFRTTTTGLDGTYRFDNVPAGSYTIVESDPVGYISSSLNTIKAFVSASQTVEANYLDLADGHATIIDPAVTKYGSPEAAAPGDTVIYTITVGNTGSTIATGVVLTDTKPAFIDILTVLIDPNPGGIYTAVITGDTFTIDFGDLDPGETYTITVITRVNSLGMGTGGDNIASVSTTSSMATDRAANNTARAALAPASAPGGSGSGSDREDASIQGISLPQTGFAPGEVSAMPPQPDGLAYLKTGLYLEAPALHLRVPIVGIPVKDGSWDISWLGAQTGYLNGTAFPTFEGNSVITGHVYLSDGLPGPFVNLEKLSWGDKIYVHAFQFRYTYEVRMVKTVGAQDRSALKHKDEPWVTLLTCKGYDQQTGKYSNRVFVQAVLVGVEKEK